MKKLAVMLGLAALVAGSAFAQNTGITNGLKVNLRQGSVVKTVDSHGDTIYVQNMVAGTPTGTAIGGVFYADSTGRIFQATTDGYLLIIDASRDRDNVLSQTIIGPSVIVSGNVDSTSTAIDVHAYTHLKLLFNIVGKDSVVTAYRLAVQCRENFNNQTDSTSTYAEAWQFASLLGQAAAPADTVSAGHLATGSATVPWSGEFVISSDAAREGPNGTAAAYSYPNNISVPLDLVYGTGHRFRYLTVRVRLLSGARATVTVRILGFSS